MEGGAGLSGGRRLRGGGRPHGLLGVHGGPGAGSSELLCHRRLPAPSQRPCYFLQDTSRARRPGWPCHGSSTDPPSPLPTREPRHSVGVPRPFQAKHSGLGSTPSWWAYLGPCPSPSHLDRASGYSPRAVASREVAPRLQLPARSQSAASLRRAHPKRAAGGARLTPSVLRAPWGSATPLPDREMGAGRAPPPPGCCLGLRGAGFSFLRLPSSHFSYLRETWPPFPTVNICDVKPGENMCLSGLILAGFHEISAPRPVYLAGLQMRGRAV